METEISYEVCFDDSFMRADGESPTVVVFKTDRLERAILERNERSDRNNQHKANHGIGHGNSHHPFYIVAVIKHVVRKKITDPTDAY